MDPITSFIVMDILEEARAMERGGADIVHLEVGEPDFAPPREVTDAICRAVSAGHTHYTHSLGVLELREAIAGWYARTYGVKVDPDCVIVTPGTSGAFLNVMAILLAPGEKIAFFDPGYPCYPNFARLLGLTPVAIPTEPEDGFDPKRDRVSEAVASGARAILVASPANPTGAIVSPDLLKWLAGLPIPLISDEIYHGLVYCDACVETAIKHSADAIVINGLSKRMAMTGLRIGWAIVPKDLVRPFQKLNQNLYICADALSQQAAITALSDPACEAEARTMKDTYARRRRTLIDGLRRVGFALHHEPMGAFYCFADCLRFTDDAFAFALRMLREAKVAATPGIDFGSYRTKTFLRFAYTIDEARIEEGVHRMGKWLGTS
jgi:aspartate/methionine/tyrosine aminotransferase